jgi:hypothetical protein
MTSLSGAGQAKITVTTTKGKTYKAIPQTLTV